MPKYKLTLPDYLNDVADDKVLSGRDMAGFLKMSYANLMKILRKEEGGEFTPSFKVGNVNCWTVAHARVLNGKVIETEIGSRKVTKDVFIDILNDYVGGSGIKDICLKFELSDQAVKKVIKAIAPTEKQIKTVEKHNLMEFTKIDAKFDGIKW